MQDRSKEKELLLNWLEEFKANYSQYTQAIDTINECEKALEQYDSIVGKLLIPIQIQQEKQKRDSKGYTIENTLNNLKNALDKGLPGDPRFPERDNQFVFQRKEEYSSLVDRIEFFKAKFGDHPDATELINETDKVFNLYNQFMKDIAVPLGVQNARNARLKDGSVLEYGLDYHLKILSNELDLPMFSMDIEKVKRLYHQLIDWLEDFKSQFLEQVLSNHPIVMKTIDEVGNIMEKYKKTIYAVTIPLAVDKARKNRELLPYGLDYHLNRFNVILNSDMSQRLDEAIQYNSQLIQWLEQFKVKFEDSKDISQVKETIEEVETLLQKYGSTIGAKKQKREMKLATESRTILPYGLDYQKSILQSSIDKKDSGNARKAAGPLMEWIEDFRSRFQYIEGSDSIILSVEDLLSLFKQTFPYEAAKQIQKQKERKQNIDIDDSSENTTTRNIDNNNNEINTDGYGSEDDEIPTSNEIKESSSMKEPEPANEKISILPEFKESESIDESSLCRTPPDVPRGDGFMQELLKKQKSVQETLKNNILLNVNWNFIKFDEFKSMEEDEQQKICQNIVFSLLSRTILSDCGFIGICQSNKLAKDILTSLVSVIELSYVTNIDSHFDFKLNNSTLEVSILLKSWKQQIDTNECKSKLENLFNLSYYNALSKLQSQSDSTGNALQKTLQRSNPILVQIENNFTEYSNFKSYSQKEQIQLIDNLAKIMKSLLITSNGLSDICEKSSTTKRFVFENIREIHIGYHELNTKDYSLTFNRENGIINFLACMDLKNIKLENLDQAFDLALGLVALKALDASKNKLQAYQNIIQRKINTSVIVEIDWDKWMNHPNFLSFPVTKQQSANQAILQTHLNDIINGEDGLIEFYNQHSELNSVINRKLKKILISYDPTDSIKHPFSSTCSFFTLYFNHRKCTLSIIGNLKSFELKSGNGWKDFGHKFLPIIQTANLRFKFDALLRKYRQDKIKPLIGNDILIKIDWDHFVNENSFLGLKKDNRTSILRSFETIHYPNLYKQLQIVCEHSIGKESIKDQIKEIHISTDETKLNRNDSSNLSGNNYNFDKENGIFYWIIPYSQLLSPGKYAILAWQLRWALGCSISIAKDIGEKKMEEYRKQACETIEKEISLNFDWKFIETSEFLETGPQPIVKTIEETSDSLIKRIFIDGLVRVCSHPIGKKSIQENINEVLVSYSPIDDLNHNDSVLSIEGSTLCIKVSKNNLHAAIQSRYKERIEFEYDLIVAIAKDNAMEVHQRVEKSIEQYTKQNIPILVDLASFTPLDVFRSKIPSDQADIITTLYSNLPVQMIESSSVGMCSFLQYDVSIEPFLKLVEEIEYRVDVKNEVKSSEGNLFLDGKKLVLEVNINDVIKSSSLTNWKERILACLDMLVNISIYETREKRNNIEKQYKKSMKTQDANIDINWDLFIKSNEFLSYHPTDRVRIIKSSNVKMLEITLLGDKGFTGSKGLCEFDDTISHLHTIFKDIKFNIIPNGSVTKVNVQSNQLILSYSLQNIDKEQYIGCHDGLEDLLDLRPIKQNAAINRANKKIESDCQSLISTYCPIIVNWDSFISSQGKDYVSIIDEVATVPKTIFMSKNMSSFGNCGIPALTASSSSLAQKLKSFKQIEVCLNPSNSVNENIGRSHTLNPSCFKVTSSGDKLTVETNLQSRMRLPGCARVIQFILCSGEALQEEQRTIHQIAANMTAQEQQRRDDAVRRAQDKNNDITKQNARDQEDYQRKMQEYHK